MFKKDKPMKRRKHGKYLIQLTRLGFFNCYIVQEQDGLTLIDTNLPGSANAIIKVVKKLQPITRIALTHAHGDHAASLDALCRELPDVEVAVSVRSARFLASDMSLDADEPQDKLRGSYVTCKTKPTTLLKPGDQFGSLQVIAAPGHTPGQIAFFDPREDVLIAGDAFQTQGGVAVAGIVRPFFPFPAMATWHKPTALESAIALRSLNPTYLATGHGAVVKQPLNKMDKAINLARERFDKS